MTFELDLPRPKSTQFGVELERTVQRATHRKIEPIVPQNGEKLNRQTWLSILCSDSTQSARESATWDLARLGEYDLRDGS